MPQDLVLQFDQATVIYEEKHSEATGQVMPKLSVQVIDAYRYQRELTVQYRWEPGDSKNLYWEYSAYRHPGRRYSDKISAKVAARFIERFLHLCKNYPTLLFNTNQDNGRSRAEGFVHLHERLLDGAEFSVNRLM